MSKVGCRCGHTIVDQTDALPYKAHALADADESRWLDTLADECASLIQAIAAGDRDRWIRRHFRDCYPTDLSDADVFHDFVCTMQARYFRSVYECTACGRILIERPDEGQHFRSFAPDSQEPESVLRSTQTAGGD